MLEKRIIRLHPITLAPDLFLLFVGGFFIKVGSMRTDWVFVHEVCYFLGGLLWMSAGLDMLCWLGFQLEVTFSTLTIRRCWVRRRRFNWTYEEVPVEFTQNWWDALWDKGTLIIYAPGGDILTLKNLAHFSSWARSWPQWVRPE